MASTSERDQWRDSFTATQGAESATAGHALVAQIEQALDRQSAPISPRIDALFQAAAAAVAGPPTTMIHFLERLFEPVEADEERRRSGRASLLATITAIPLAENLEPCGEPFKAAARDASAGGLSLLHTRAVTAAWLALRWASMAAPGRLVTTLLRSRSLPGDGAVLRSRRAFCHARGLILAALVITAAARLDRATTKSPPSCPPALGIGQFPRAEPRTLDASHPRRPFMALRVPIVLALARQTVASLAASN